MRQRCARPTFSLRADPWRLRALLRGASDRPEPALAWTFFFSLYLVYILKSFQSDTAIAHSPRCSAWWFVSNAAASQERNIWPLQGCWKVTAGAFHAKYRRHLQHESLPFTNQRNQNRSDPHKGLSRQVITAAPSWNHMPSQDMTIKEQPCKIYVS